MCNLTRMGKDNDREAVMWGVIVLGTACAVVLVALQVVALFG